MWKYCTLEPLSQFTRPIKLPQMWLGLCANMSKRFPPAAAKLLKRCLQDLLIQGQIPSSGVVVASMQAGPLEQKRGSCGLH